MNPSLSHKGSPGYFLDGVRYLQAAEMEVGTPSLFDLVEAAS